ncbi:MAG: hypothetical protein ACRBDL_00410 [Alphaproteobacteria bacterium]
MRYLTLLLVGLCLPLGACVEQTLQQSVGNLTSAMPSLSQTTKEMHGVVLSVKSCSISTTRVATCRMSAMSKYQDRSLNLIGGTYTKIQDDTGVSYNTLLAFGRDATDRSQRQTTLIADTPYEFTIRAENLSTRATKIRAITVQRMDVLQPGGTGFIGYIKMNFPHPPMGQETYQAHQKSAPASPAVKEQATTNTQANTTTSVASGDMPYRYLFTQIVPIHANLPSDPLLAKGAYLHLREDGALGHNFSKPGPYGYVPKQGWRMEKDKLVIIFDQISYSFDLPQSTTPMVTYLDQGGAYKMSITPKAQAQR